jgi:hypothetical protein
MQSGNYGGEMDYFIYLVVAIMTFIVFFLVLRTIFRISNEMVKNNEILETHTRLLTVIANGVNSKSDYGSWIWNPIAMKDAQFSRRR